MIFLILFYVKNECFLTALFYHARLKIWLLLPNHRQRDDRDQDQLLRDDRDQRETIEIKV